MAAIVFMQIGNSGIDQLEITEKSFSKRGHGTPLVLYTNQLEASKERLHFINDFRAVDFTDDDKTHADYGGEKFSSVTLMKIEVMIDALQQENDWILFSDVDIFALADFKDSLENLLERNSIWVSCEGIVTDTLAYCTGLLLLKKEDKVLNILKKWREHQVLMMKENKSAHDQIAFNDLLIKNPAIDREIRAFPNGYAMPGWFFNMFYPAVPLIVGPKFFHCNWVAGNEAKVNRLRYFEKVVNKRTEYKIIIFAADKLTKIANFFIFTPKSIFSKIKKIMVKS